MFSLNDKLRVLNRPTDVKLFASDNTEITTVANLYPGVGSPAVPTPITGGRLEVDGFGTFELSKIIDIKCRRAVAKALDSRVFTVPAVAGILAGNSVEVMISIETNRYQAEVLTTQHIGKGRTIKFQTLPFTADSPNASTIATAITAGWTNWLNTFTHAVPMITISNSGAALTVSAATNYESLTITKVEVRRVAAGIPSSFVYPLVQASVASVGTEGQGQGKFLEESIRMATGANNDVYGVDTLGTGVDIRGAYTEVHFRYLTSFDADINPHGANAGNSGEGIPATHGFTLFLNEATCLAANSAIAKCAGVALHRVLSAVPGLTATDISGGLTVAQERSEVLIISPTASVDSVAEFIA